MFEPVNTLGPVAAGAGGTGGAGGGACYAAICAACQCFATSLMRSFAIYGADNETCATWLYTGPYQKAKQH